MGEDSFYRSSIFCATSRWTAQWTVGQRTPLELYASWIIEDFIEPFGRLIEQLNCSSNRSTLHWAVQRLNEISDKKRSEIPWAVSNGSLNRWTVHEQVNCSLSRSTVQWDLWQRNSQNLLSRSNDSLNRWWTVSSGFGRVESNFGHVFCT